MRKTIERQIEFSEKDIQDALLDMLMNRDHPTPHPGEAKWRHGPEGFTLTWTEVQETGVPAP